MSDCERFAQVTQRKWGNEQFAQKIWLKKSKILFFSMFYIRFLILKVSKSLIHSFWVSDVSDCSGRSPKMSDVSESLKSLTKNQRPWAICSHRSEELSDHERIAQVAHQKWGMSESLFFWANCSFAHFWAKHERFARKTDERIPSPARNSLTYKADIQR